MAAQDSKSSSGQANQPAQDPNEDIEVDMEPSMLAKVCFYTFGFLAYWFGSSRFDMDGDGDFDASDVEAIMKGKKKIGSVANNFKRPPVSKKDRIQKKNEQTSKQEKDNEMPRGNSNNSNTISDALGTEVEDGDEAAEIAASLRQHLPWFTIVEVVAILGLWAVFAFMDFPYDRIASTQVPAADAVLSDYTTGASVPVLSACQRECSLNEACVGVAFKEGAFAECKLLKALPSNPTLSATSCTVEDWNWVTYKRLTWSLEVWMANQGGIENWFPGQTALTSHSMCEPGFDLTFLYRWWSYQFTHGGLPHVGANSFMTIMLGIPLEGLHGPFRYGLMWTCGVLGGALNWALFDPYRTTYGASGGCFSLLGMHLAALIMNWKQKRFRWVELFMLMFLAAVEVAGFWASHSGDSGGSLTAHCAHVGGLIAGMLIGVCVGRNIHEEKWEKVVQALCWIGGLGMCLFGIVWWFAVNPFPAIANLWDPGEHAFCWIGQVCVGEDGQPCPVFHTAFRPDWYGAQHIDSVFNQCTFCKTRECVEGWYSDVVGEQYRYCPRSASYAACNRDFKPDDWKETFFYPPSTMGVDMPPPF
jgi:membrane associated rhomboid family serine protease